MVKIRWLRPSDVPAMIALWDQSGLPIRKKGRESSRALRAEMLKYPRNFIGAFDDGKLVGVVIVTSDGRKGYVNRLAVHPDYRRKGVATSLMRKSEDELRTRGIGIVTALIERGNKVSFALFNKSGYEIRDDITYVRKELMKGV